MNKFQTTRDSFSQNLPSTTGKMAKRRKKFTEEKRETGEWKILNFPNEEYTNFMEIQHRHSFSGRSSRRSF